MRLINADNLREEWLINGSNENIYCTNDFLASIDVADTIDAQPVIHARWLFEVTHNGCTQDYDCVCRICGYSGVPYWNYCPNCGAKMDLEQI